MKKFILGIATLLITLVACDRELEIGSDFEFKVNNIDDSEIFINNVKSFELEITKMKNVIDNKNYEFTYKVSGGNLIVKDGSNTLIEGNYYPYEVNNLNKIHLDLIPQSDGVLTVEFKLKDNNGVERVKEILVYCTDEDFQYTFTGTAPVPTGIVGSGIQFNLLLTNTGLSSNSFQLKYTSSGTGTITISSAPIAPNTYFNVTPGTIQGLFFSNNVGTETLVFTCIDASGHEQQVSFAMTMSANPFALAKLADFSVKNTKQKVFDFTLTNTLAGATYEIKFTSVNTSKTYTVGNTLIPQNVWHPLTLNVNNLYSYIYESLSNTNDVLTVHVRDSYGQVQTIDYNITMFAKPLLTNLNGRMVRSAPNYSAGFFNYWRCNYTSTVSYITTLSNSASIVEVKIILFNNNTGNIETKTFTSGGTNTLESSYYQSSTGAANNSTESANAYINAISHSKYAGENFTIQVRDSDNVWSEVYNGTIVIQP